MPFFWTFNLSRNSEFIRFPQKILSSTTVFSFVRIRDYFLKHQQKSCRPWSLNILTIVLTLNLLSSCMALFSVKAIWLFKIFRQSFLTYPGVPGINNEHSWRLLQIISSALMYVHLYQFHNCYLNTPSHPKMAPIASSWPHKNICYHVLLCSKLHQSEVWQSPLSVPTYIYP